MKSLVKNISSEYASLTKDPWLVALTLFLPLILSVLFMLIFSAGIPRDISIGIVDLDNSQLSRKVSRYLDASDKLAVTQRFTSVKSADAALKNVSIYALVVIPRNLSRDVTLGKAPEITGFINSQYLLTGKSIRSTLIEIEATLALELDLARTLISKPVFQAALATVMPLQSQISALYNLDMDYSQFLVPALIMSLMQIIICSVTAMALGKGLSPEHIQSRNLQKASQVFIAKVLPYTFLFSIQMLLLIFLSFVWQPWPNNGAIIGLLPFVILFVLACQVVGALFYVLTFDLVRCLSIVGAFTAPAFAFLGVTFPASQMSPFAQFWRSLMPATHYLDAYNAQINYASPFMQLLWLAFILACYLIVLPWALRRYVRAKRKYNVRVPETT